MAEPAQIRFNSLGGTTSRIVAVYRGPGITPADRVAVGTYPHGEVAFAICKVLGRKIVSDTQSGEEPRASNTWVRINTALAEPMFATLTYVDIDPAALVALPNCT